MSIKDIKKALSRTFQGVLKNIVSLANDSTLESDLKPLKIGDKATNIELSETETKLSGQLTVDGNAETNIKTTHGLNLWSGSGTLEVKATDAGIEIEGSNIDIQSNVRDININSERDLELSTKRDILLEHDDTVFGLIDGGTSSAKSRMFLYEAGGSSTDDYFLINVTANGATALQTIDAGGAVAHLTLDPDGELNFTPETEVKSDAPLKIKEAANAVADTAAYGQLWVKTATPNELYFTTDAGDDIQLTSGTSTAGGGGTSYWNQMVPGYTTNKTSTTTYYTFYRGWYENWTNGDSSPTTINDTDTYSTFFIAPRAGTITNIKIQGYCQDTGATDPFKFYFYKGAMVGDADSMSLSAMFNSGTITPPSANKTWTASVDFSSSNSFSEDDCLYVFWKKDSNSGSQDVYWNMNISGEYD